MIAHRLPSLTVAALVVALPISASADASRDEPAPLLDLVRDICLEPRHDIDQAVAAVQTSFGMTAIGKIEKDEGVFWDAGKQISRFGVSYLMIGAVGRGKANALLAHVTGDSGTFESGLRSLASVTFSERKTDEISHPSVDSWSLDGASNDGETTLKLSSQTEILADGAKTNIYSFTCGRRAER